LEVEKKRGGKGESIFLIGVAINRGDNFLESPFLEPEEGRGTKGIS